MEFQDALSFALAAPFIAAIIGFVKGFVEIPSKWIPPIAVALAYGWGAVLWVSDLWEGVAASFVVVGFTVGLAASGLQSVARTYVPAKPGP